MTHTSKPFCVRLWGSHPDAGNDDCHSDSDHDSLEEAERVFEAPSHYYVHFLELTGPEGLRRVRENPSHDPKRRAREAARDDADWRREQAMQAGMGLGIDAYNDEMGYD